MDSGDGGAGDRALIGGVVHGDEEALRALYDRYGGLVLTLAVRLTGDRQAAEEVMQDVFLRCWSSAHTYTPDRGTVAGWLMGMTRNRAIDHVRETHARRRDRSLTVPLESSHNGHGPAGPEATIELADVRGALAALPEDQRTAVALALYGGMTQTEIAERLQAPLGTIKSRIRMGMARLRKRLEAAEVRP